MVLSFVGEKGDWERSDVDGWLGFADDTSLWFWQTRFYQFLKQQQSEQT
jgi:hypothetical protein